MARGHQKIQSQAKAQEKAAKAKKQSGHSANDQKKAAQKALVISCAVCKVSEKERKIKHIKYFHQISFTIFNLLKIYFSHKCPIQRHINNISRTSIQNPNCLLI